MGQYDALFEAEPQVQSKYDALFEEEPKPTTTPKPATIRSEGQGPEPRETFTEKMKAMFAGARPATTEEYRRQLGGPEAPPDLQDLAEQARYAVPFDPEKIPSATAGLPTPESLIPPMIARPEWETGAGQIDYSPGEIEPEEPEGEWGRMVPETLRPLYHGGLRTAGETVVGNLVPILAARKLLPPEHPARQVAEGLTTGAGALAETLGHEDNLAIMAALGPLAGAEGVAGLAGRGVSAYFAADMASHTPELWEQFKAAPDVRTKTAIATQALGVAGMSFLAGQHAVGERAIPGAVGPRTAAEAVRAEPVAPLPEAIARQREAQLRAVVKGPDEPISVEPPTPIEEPSYAPKIEVPRPLPEHEIRARVGEETPLRVEPERVAGKEAVPGGGGAPEAEAAVAPTAAPEAPLVKVKHGEHAKEGYTAVPSEELPVTPEVTVPPEEARYTREGAPPPTEPPVSEPVPAGEPERIGIAERYREEQQPGSVIPGVGVTSAEARAYGQDFINKGGDPFMPVRRAKAGNTSWRDVGIVRAEYERLSNAKRAAEDALERNPGDPRLQEAFNAADEAQRQWSKDMQPVLTRSGDALRAATRSYPREINSFSDFTDILNDHFGGDVTLTPQKRAEIQRAVRGIKKVNQEANGARQQVTDAATRKAGGRTMSFEELKADLNKTIETLLKDCIL